MNFLITIALILFASLLFSEIAYRLKIPIVVGQIIAGILLSIPLFSQFFLAKSTNIVHFMADLGIIFLLFLAGMSVSWNRMYGARKDIMLIGLFGSFVPFVLGFIVMNLLGYDNLLALIVGVCLSITSEGTKARVLMELKKMRTKIGATMLGAGIIDDVIGLALFITITSVLGHKIITESFKYSPLEIIGFLAIIILTFKLLPRLIKYEEKEDGEMREVSLFTTAMLLCLLFAIFGLIITGTMTGGIIAAFVAGVIIQLSLNHKEELNIRRHFEIMALSFIIPFFFIGIGIDFDIASLTIDLPLVMALTLAAVIGKIGGVFLVKPFTRLSWKQLHLIGWGMNSRGAVELVIALMAVRAGLLTTQVYSAIVVMTILTTLMFPFMLRFLIKRDPHIMD